MKKYKIIIYDDFFNKRLESEIEAKNEPEALKETRDFYAVELDTFPESINVISCVEIKQ